MNRQSMVRAIGFSLIMISVSAAGVGAMASLTNQFELPPEVESPPPGIMEMEAFGASARATMPVLAWYGIAAAAMTVAIILLLHLDRTSKEVVPQ